LARGFGFDYGEDFEIYCHLSFHAARQGKNAVAGQVGEIPPKKLFFGFFQLKKLLLNYIFGLRSISKLPDLQVFIFSVSHFLF
jgi:hypothetical protein